MLVEKNEICKIIENRLRINFDELELVGKYDNYFDTLLYKSNNKLYTIQIYENKISSISKVEKIESEKEPNCFMTTMINGIMYYIKDKELLYITKCDRKYNYIHFKNGKAKNKIEAIQKSKIIFILPTINPSKKIAIFIISKIPNTRKSSIHEENSPKNE